MTIIYLAVKSIGKYESNKKVGYQIDIAFLSTNNFQQKIRTKKMSLEHSNRTHKFSSSQHN